MSSAPAESFEAFGLTADPSAYVPSPERERALDQLAAALEAGAVPCLEGPTGIGKTLLLQLLAQRVSERFDALYLPYPMLSCRELCSLAMGLLGHDEVGDPDAALGRLAAERAAGGRPLLLLIDDAASLPPDSARGLAALRTRSRGSLHIALAGIGGDALLDATAAFGDTLLRVALEEGIPDEGLRDYVARQLERARAPASLRDVFDDGVLQELRRAAAGNPRRLHLAAQTIVRRAEAGPTGSRHEPPPRHEAPTAPERAETTPRAGRAEPVAVARVTLSSGGVGPSGDVAPFGEYRFVRRRLVDASASPAPAEPSSPAAPADAPPAQVDLTLAAMPAPAAEEAAARRRKPPAASPARELAPARPLRRGPSLPVVVAVAALSALLGFALALQFRRDAGEGAGEAPPSEARTTAPGRAPAALEPIPPIPTRDPQASEAREAPVLAAPAPAPPPAERIEISINATPWAIIEVDGRELGETPLGGVSLSRGPHRFVARFPDGRVLERSVEIDTAHRTLVFE